MATQTACTEAQRFYQQQNGIRLKQNLFNLQLFTQH